MVQAAAAAMASGTARAQLLGRSDAPMTAMLRVSGREFALIDRLEQERVLAGWGDALAAKGEIDAGSDDVAYLGAKITTARFYAEQCLPLAHGIAQTARAGAGALYEVDATTLESV